MSVEILRDPMAGSTYLRNGGVNVKLDPMVADAFAELQSSMSALGAEQMRRLLEKELGKSKSLGAMNSKPREQLQDAERDESRAWDRVRKAETESAKLQEQGARLFDKTLELGTENAKLRKYITKLEQANIVLDSDNTELRNDMRDMQMFVSENAKLREVARELRANLCNRETLLELLGMPSTAETKAAMEDLFNRCDELGVD